MKALSNKDHLSAQFWGLAYMHCVHILNILPNRQSGKSPYTLWWNRDFDLTQFPLLPFGSVIMGNIPTELQTSRSGRASETYFVGCSELHSGAIKLFNPTTKRVILRHSFKYLSDVELSSTTFVSLKLIPPLHPFPTPLYYLMSPL